MTAEIPYIKFRCECNLQFTCFAHPTVSTTNTKKTFQKCRYMCRMFELAVMDHFQVIESNCLVVHKKEANKNTYTQKNTDLYRYTRIEISNNISFFLRALI